MTVSLRGSQKSMLNAVSRNSKWLITGSLATQELQLAMNIKATQRKLNPTRVFSSDKTLACVAHGLDLSSCQNHDEKQFLVVEVDGSKGETQPWQENEKKDQSSGVHTTCSGSNGEENDIQVERSRTTKRVTCYDCFMRA